MKKNILLLMSGSIACAKATGLVSAWVKAGHAVEVACTRSVAKFVGHATLEVTKAQIGAIASLLEHTARDTDVVARYSPDEFVVLMPQTSLAGAAIFSQRLLDTSDRELGLFVFGGIVEVQPGDTPEKILSRADSALYSARSEGQSCLYQHTGKAIRPHDRSSLPESDGSPFFDSQADLREPAEMLG